MAKQIAVTSEIAAQISKIAGSDVTAAGVAVFECIAANTLPLNKRGSIFDKGTITESTLAEMANWISSRGAPMHTMHQNSSELPVGKAFNAEVVHNDNGMAELRVQFFLDASEEQLISKVNAGTIDEVSIGSLANHLLCSECGWDYMSDEADIMNFIDRTCDNEHTLGIDGVHLNIVGVDTFYELSLVSQGAANNPKIVSPSQARLDNESGEEDVRKLAAAGIPLNQLTLVASATLSGNKESRVMSGEKITLDGAQLVTDLADARVALAAAQGQVENLTAEKTGLEAQVAELTAKVEAAADAAADEIKAELDGVKADLEAATNYLRDQAKKVLVATGSEDPQVDDLSVEQLSAVIDEGQAKLASLIPAGGKSASAVTLDNDDENAKARLSAFKVRA